MTDKIIEKVAQAHYEETVRLIPCEIPRLGMRNATWEEITGESKENYLKAMKVAIDSLGIIILPKDAELQYLDIYVYDDEPNNPCVHLLEKPMPDNYRILRRAGKPVLVEE